MVLRNRTGGQVAAIRVIAGALVLGLVAASIAGCSSSNSAASDASASEAGATGGGAGSAAGGGAGTGTGGTGLGGGAGVGGVGGGGGSHMGPCSTSGCPAGQFCAYAVWNGLVNVDTCLPLGDCVTCACAMTALSTYYSSRFPPPAALPPQCGCLERTSGADAGMTAVRDGGGSQGPAVAVFCSGA